MARYAEKTKVGAESSRAEIERTLHRYGATGFMYGWEENRAIVGFKMKDRHIRFVLQMPDKNANEFCQTPARGYARDEKGAFAAWEQATRQRWRALALAVKAKLEAVEAGIATFEQEFLAHIVLPDNRTVGEWIKPQIQTAYESGKMPKLLPAVGESNV